MFVTFCTPPRKGVRKAPGVLVGAACTTVIFQKGLLVCTMTSMPFVLLVAVNVNGRPFADVAVIGRMSDLPAGTVTLPKGSITGAARTINASMGTTAKRRLNRIKKRHIMDKADLSINLAQTSAQLKFFLVTKRCRSRNRTLFVKAATRRRGQLDRDFGVLEKHGVAAGSRVFLIVLETLGITLSWRTGVEIHLADRRHQQHVPRQLQPVPLMCV